MKLILLIEDEYGLAEVLRLLLEHHGYRVALASNGRAALELLSAERPAIIVSDFMMPHMTGGEFGLALRASEALRDIPFVLMSATNEDVVQRVFADYDAFVAKPTPIDDLLALVERLAANGREPRKRSAGVDESIRHLFKGIELPPAK